MNDAVLLLGSNLGDRILNIKNAIELLKNYGCEIVKFSNIIETEPVGFVSCNNFCNIALLIKSQKSPVKLLNLIKEIEKKIGRKEDSAEIGQYTDRLIDMDIVYFNHLNFLSNKLEIPHKRNAFDRDFSVKLINELF